MTAPRNLLRALALAAPFLAAVGCNDDDNGGGPDVTLAVDAVLDGNGGIVVVTDGGVGVTGADVTLNTTAGVAGATDGEYTVTLAAPVAAGGALTLDVTDGVAIVQGNGTVPEAPVVTAPADAAGFSTAQEIAITWTATADPARWVVDAQGPTVELFDVAGGGAARTFTIPAGTLDAGDWELRVYAVNDGVVSGDAEAGSGMEIRGVAATYPTVVVSAPVLVTGDFMGAQEQSIHIEQGGAVVNDATVTVNGTAAIQAGAGTSYTAALAAPLAVGGALDLDIAFGAVVIAGAGTLPEAPVVTAPADGAAIAVADPIEVTWTATVDPSRWVVHISDGANDFDMDVAGNARTATFAAGTIPVGGPYVITVFASNDGTFTGPAAAESRMNIRNENVVKPDFTVTAP